MNFDNTRCKNERNEFTASETPNKCQNPKCQIWVDIDQYVTYTGLALLMASIKYKTRKNKTQH